jgi:hypothetical protein
MEVIQIEEPDIFVSELINSDPYILVYIKSEKKLSNYSIGTLSNETLLEEDNESQDNGKLDFF